MIRKQIIHFVLLLVLSFSAFMIGNQYAKLSQQEESTETFELTDLDTLFYAEQDTIIFTGEVSSKFTRWEIDHSINLGWVWQDSVWCWSDGGTVYCPPERR